MATITLFDHTHETDERITLVRLVEILGYDATVAQTRRFDGGVEYTLTDDAADALTQEHESATDWEAEQADQKREQVSW